MDISNKNGDIAIGGYSRDLGVVSSDSNTFIGLMPSSGFEYKWIKQTTQSTNTLKTISFHPTYDYLVVLTESPIAIIIIDVNNGNRLKSAKNIDSTKMTNAPGEMILIPNSNYIYMTVPVDGYRPAVAIFNLMDVSSNEIQGVYVVGLSMSTQTIFLGNNNDLYLGGEASIPPSFEVCHSVVKLNLEANTLSLDWLIVNTDKPSGGQVTKKFAQAPSDTSILFGCSVTGWDNPGPRMRVMRFYLPDMPPQRLPTTISAYPILNFDFYAGVSDDAQCQDLKALTTSQLILSGYDSATQKTLISVINFKNDDTIDYTVKYLQTSPLIGFNSYKIKIIDSTNYYFTGSTWGMPDCADSLSYSVGVIMKLDSDELCSSFPQTLTTESGVLSHMPSTKFKEISGLFLSYGKWLVEREQIQTLDLVGQSKFGPNCCKYEITKPTTKRRQYIIDTPMISINFDPFKINETCDDLSFTYTNKLSSGSSLPSYIAVTPPKINVGITSDSNLKGLKTVRIQAQLTNGQEEYIDYEILFKSTDYESEYEIYSITIPNYEYIVGQNKLTITFDDFVATPDGYPIMYFLALQSGGNYDTSVITFTNATEINKKIEIYTNDNTKKDMKLRVIAKFSQNTAKQAYADFTLKILDQCYRLSITTQPILDQVYYVNDNAQTVYGNNPSNPWTLSIPACAPLVYSFQFLTISPNSSDLLLISTSSSLMTIFSKSQSDLGEYQVKVIGKAKTGNITASVNFNINVRCKVRLLIPVLLESMSFNYKLKTALPMIVQFQEFKKDPHCQVPVTYSARFINGTEMTYGEPIRFLPLNRIFATGTFNEDFVGSYQIELQGLIQDIKYNISSSFKFFINIIAVNSTEAISRADQLSIEEFTVYAGQTDTYPFPQRAGDDQYILTYEDRIHNGFTDDEFIVPQKEGKLLKVTPQAIHVGTHIVTAKAYQFYQSVSGCKTCGRSIQLTQQVNVIILFDEAYIAKQQKELEDFRDSHKKLIEILEKMAKAGEQPYDKDLSAKIKSITSGGVVVVEFSQEMRVPPNYTAFNESFLEFRVKQDYDRSSLNLKFTWNITDFWDKYMRIQLYFEDPLDVSRYEFDTLAIKFIKNEYFIPKKTYLPISQKYEINKRIPRQMPIADAELLNTIGEVIAQILSGGIMGNSIINYIFKLNQKLWDSIYFNMLTRLMIEGCLQYSLCSLLNINNLVFTNNSDAFSSIFSIVIILILTFLIYFNFFKVSKEIYSFEKNQQNTSTKMEKYQDIQQEGGQFDIQKSEEEIKQQIDKKFYHKFSSLYNDLKPDNILALQYQSVYIGRRIAVSVIMIFLRDFPNSQIFLMLAQSVANMYYIVKIRPFITNSTNMLELFNELCISVCLYHMIVFSDLYDDPLVKYNFGWSLTKEIEKEQKYLDIKNDQEFFNIDGNQNQNEPTKIKKKKNFVLDQISKYFQQKKKKFRKPQNKGQKQSINNNNNESNSKQNVKDYPVAYNIHNQVNLNSSSMLNDTFQNLNLNSFDSMIDSNTKDFMQTLKNKTIKRKNQEQMLVQDIFNDDQILNHKGSENKPSKIKKNLRRKTVLNDDEFNQNVFEEIDGNIKADQNQQLILRQKNECVQKIQHKINNQTNKQSKYIKKKHNKRKRQSHIDIGLSDLNNNDGIGFEQKNTVNNKNSSDILGDYNKSFLFLDQPMKKFGLRNYNENINVLETKKELEKQQILNNYDFDNLQFNKF
eukprot:403367204